MTVQVVIVRHFTERSDIAVSGADTTGRCIFVGGVKHGL